mmetsp:Transcript_44038/g.50920  ORF Transcript_44038/g.50920 Transcript_44038/m.50920 type:complete len:275 (-) Transcript_44038:119-943(-)
MMFGKDPVWGSGAAPGGAAAMLMRQGSSGGMLSGGSGGGPMMVGSSSALGSQPMGGFGLVPEKPPLCKYYVNGGCIKGDQCNYLHELPDERHLDVNGLGFIFNSNVHNAQKGVTSAVAAQVAAHQHQIGGVSMPSVPPIVGVQNSVMPVTPSGHMGMPQSQTSSGNSGMGLNGMGLSVPAALAGGLGGAGATGAQGILPGASSVAVSSALASSGGGGRKPMKKIVPKYRPPEPFLEHNLPPALAIPFHTSQKDIQQALAMCLLEGCLSPPNTTR